jgi:hypothetical protein
MPSSRAVCRFVLAYLDRCRIGKHQDALSRCRASSAPSAASRHRSCYIRPLFHRPTARKFGPASQRSHIACTQSAPNGGLGAREGMQGAMNPSVRTRGAAIAGNRGLLPPGATVRLPRLGLPPCWNISRSYWSSRSLALQCSSSSDCGSDRCSSRSAGGTLRGYAARNPGVRWRLWGHLKMRGFMSG